MVQLRVIHGGKGGRSPESGPVELFSAYSVVDNFLGHDCVRLNWIRHGRTVPVARYEALIEEYTKIDKRMRFYYEEYIKELFTGEEIEKLRPYITTALGLNLNVVEEKMPLSYAFAPMPFGQLGSGGAKGIYSPQCNEVQDLPFQVCSHYDLSKCPPSIALQPAEREQGMAFAEFLLKHVGMGWKDELRDTLRDAVEKAYDEAGLFVGKGATREDRIKERSKFFKLDSGPSNE